MIELPRESVEYLPLSVRVDGAPVTAGVEVSVVSRARAADTTRPASWAPATETPTGPVFLIRDLPPGIYRVWARVIVPDSDERPVLDLDTFRIT